MPIELTCPSCGQQLRLADEHAGKAGRCPACQGTFQIPTASEQSKGVPFGSGAPQPFGSSPEASPAGNQFGEQKPNPFASTGGMQSPYGGANPYTSQQTPNMYGGPPASASEGTATASIVLGIVSIVFSFIPCCCLNLLISVPCGIIGLVLSFQVPPERRMVGMILNIIGLGLTVLIFGGWLILSFAGGMGQQGPNFDF